MSQKTALSQVETDSDYVQLEKVIAERIAALDVPLFTTDAQDIFGLYLDGIDEKVRQHYNCQTCRRFLNGYGGLVTITGSGHISPAIVSPMDIPEPFRRSFERMMAKVASAKVTGLLVNDQNAWGQVTPMNGWSHLSGVPRNVYVGKTQTAEQVMAEKKQDFIMLSRALGEIPMEAAVQAVRVLESDHLDRSEKTLGAATWFLNLHDTIKTMRGVGRSNLIWRAVASAKAGWCHIRSGMLRTLLDDIVEGREFEDIKARWNAKMHPLQYQRPQAAPKEGNIEAANKLIDQLGARRSLERRFARLEDITVRVWEPKNPPESAPQEETGGTFDRLKGKSRSVKIVKPVKLPSQKVTATQLVTELLPKAWNLELEVPYLSPGFFGMVTAVDPDAPAIIQWDGLEGCPRCPLFWYFYNDTTSFYAKYWNLKAGEWARVTAICNKPPHWYKPESFPHFDTGLMVLLEGMIDTRMPRNGSLFPEILKSEFHSIRSVVEAHAKDYEILGSQEATANGILIGSSKRQQVLRIRMNKEFEYLLTY